MPFADNITTYYTLEMRHCLFASLVGLILLIIGLALLYESNQGTLLRGVSISLSIGCLIFLLGGFFAGLGAKKTLPQKLEFYKTSTAEWLQEEHAKVEQIHKNWTGTRIFWTLILAVAAAMFFAVGKPFLTCIAIGILIIGTVGHIGEAVSYQHNEKYRLEIQGLAADLLCNCES